MGEHIPLLRALRRSRLPMLVGCLLLCAPAWADIDVDIKGVNDEVRRNVLTYLSFERYKKRPNVDRDTLDRLLNRVEREVQAALRPFGYYDPKVQASLEERGHDNWRVHVQIDPGQPVIVTSVDVTVSGPGAHDPLFGHITAHLPLSVGALLSHAASAHIKTST